MDSKISRELVKILQMEVKPALGCTEPGAVALAASRAREVLEDDIEGCDIYVSPNIYKNGMGVGIPGIDEVGLSIAACMGIAGGDSSLGLSSLETVSSEEIKLAKELKDSGKIRVHLADTIEKIYIQVDLQGKKNFSKVIISGRHDEFVYIQRNDEVILNIDAKKNSTASQDSIFESITVEQLIKEIETLDFEDIKFLLEGITMNKTACDAGLSHKMGAGVGYSMKKALEDGFISDDLVNKAAIMTSAASDARMSGAKIPVMSSNGSGNHGLTAILPIAAYAEKFPQSDERLARALAISHLMTAFVKNFTGRLSAICGCSVAAGTGAAAGISWLMNLSYKQIEGAVMNMIGNLSGMVCDGAKPGCAYKLASAAGAAVQSALFVKYDSVIPSLNGIIGSTVEESIRNLGTVCDKGMTITDKIIVEVMDASQRRALS